MIVSTGPKIPVAAVFTQKEQIDEETARRVTRDALAVKHPVWMVVDAAFDMLGWHDDFVEELVVPVAPYNPRNTDEPLAIKYRVEDRIEEHGEDVHLKRSELDETYDHRTQVEPAIGASKDCGLGALSVRGRVESHVCLSLCLRLATAYCKLRTRC